jgi:RNA recognition motif-containing protein
MQESEHMGRKLYVGNLPYETGEQDLQTMFEAIGPVESVQVMRDMATGRARGFGFVEMVNEDDGRRRAGQQQPLAAATTVNRRVRPGAARHFGGGS